MGPVRDGVGGVLRDGAGLQLRPLSQWPSPADHYPLSRPAFPAFSFGGRRPASKAVEARSRPQLPQVWDAHHCAQPPLQVPPQVSGGEKRPSPNTYDILPGCCLQTPRPPAFSMSRSPAFTSWVSSCKEDWENGGLGGGRACRGLGQVGAGQQLVL